MKTAQRIVAAALVALICVLTGGCTSVQDHPQSYAFYEYKDQGQKIRKPLDDKEIRVTNFTPTFLPAKRLLITQEAVQDPLLEPLLSLSE